MKILTILLIILFFNNPVFAWDGYDYENDTAIEIGKGNLVREGNIIKIYDWKADQYHEVQVKLMEDSFNSVRLEVYDLDTKQNRVFEMEN